MVTASAAPADAAGIRRVRAVNGSLRRPRRLPSSASQRLPRSSRHHRLVRRTRSPRSDHWSPRTSTGGLPDAGFHQKTRREVLAESAGVQMRRHCARTARHVAVYDDSVTL